MTWKTWPAAAGRFLLALGVVWVVLSAYGDAGGAWVATSASSAWQFLGVHHQLLLMGAGLAAIAVAALAAVSQLPLMRVLAAAAVLVLASPGAAVEEARGAAARRGRGNS